MIPTARDENAKTLAALLGVDENEAAELLDMRVLVTSDMSCIDAHGLAEKLYALLSRTAAEVCTQPGGKFQVEIVIGDAQRRLTTVPTVWISTDRTSATISSNPIECARIEPTHGALGILVACHACALAMKVALRAQLPFASDFTIRLDWQKLFGTDAKFLQGNVEVGDVHLAGAGAVGNAFVFALKEFQIYGRVLVCDPKTVMPGSLNRCVWFDDTVLHLSKAESLCIRAQPSFKGLQLMPRPVTVSRVVKEGGSQYRISKLVVGTDTRPGRRSLQGELPGQVFDASTTDIREIVLHFNTQPSNLACLSCIYPETDKELQHQRHVAEALGVDVSDVLREFVSPSVAKKICLTYPGLDPNTLVDRAFDSLFRELCGQGLLRSAENRQVLAPFCFVSVLAGTYLAIEFVLRHANGFAASRFNYWRVSPWHNPNPELRQMRPRLEGCEFCSNSTLQTVNEAMWTISAA